MSSDEQDFLRQRGWSAEEVAAAASHLDRIDWNNYEYADNFRYARNWVDQELKEYQDALNRGCCGYSDREIPVAPGIVLVGFNYGH